VPVRLNVINPVIAQNLGNEVSFADLMVFSKEKYLMTYTWRQSVAGIEMAALLCQSPAAAQSAEKAAPAAESSAAATSADQNSVRNWRR
jgi:hypothetical protein